MVGTIGLGAIAPLATFCRFFGRRPFNKRVLSAYLLVKQDLLCRENSFFLSVTVHPFDKSLWYQYRVCTKYSKLGHYDTLKVWQKLDATSFLPYLELFTRPSNFCQLMINVSPIITMLAYWWCLNQITCKCLQINESHFLLIAMLYLIELLISFTNEMVMHSPSELCHAEIPTLSEAIGPLGCGRNSSSGSVLMKETESYP